MRIAVTYDDGAVFQHFGKTAQFKIYDVNGDRILGSQVVDTDGAGHGALADFLKHEQVDILICGGIGAGAQTALMNAGILFRGGIAGGADAAVQAYLDGTLAEGGGGCCHHHGEDHDCGHHHEAGGCGHHGCGHH